MRPSTARYSRFRITRAKLKRRSIGSARAARVLVVRRPERLSQERLLGSNGGRDRRGHVDRRDRRDDAAARREDDAGGEHRGPDVERMPREAIGSRARHLAALLQVTGRPHTERFAGESHCQPDDPRLKRRPRKRHGCRRGGEPQWHAASCQQLRQPAHAPAGTRGASRRRATASSTSSTPMLVMQGMLSPDALARERRQRRS